jgi:hypothetical protein
MQMRRTATVRENGGGGYTANRNHYDDNNNNMSLGTTHSTTELISQHWGILLKKSERMMRAVAACMPVGEIGRRATLAASTIKVNARRLSGAAHSRSFNGGGTTALPGTAWSDVCGEVDFEDADSELMDLATGRRVGHPWHNEEVEIVQVF